MKTELIAFILTCMATTTLWAQEAPVILFPKGAPGESTPLAEKKDTDGNKVGGESVLRLTNVSEPTITVYHAPQELATGAAVVVCPGGAYNILAYDMEGEETCLWLNDLGITAVLLKYRVPRRTEQEKHAAPLQDVQRTLGYVRAHADEFQIDPKRIGVMGFSAGAHLSVMASTQFAERTYPTVDAADQVSCRPDFCLLVYPAYLAGENFTLSPEIKVTANTPPTFIVQTEDDKGHINSSLFYYYALKEAGVPAQMHLYSNGGHGYGLRNTEHAVNEWPFRAEDWFTEIGVIETYESPIE